MEIVQAVKMLNSISRERLNFRRRPVLCTTLYINPIQASNFGGTFDKLFFELFCAIFMQDAHLLFLYHGAKKVQKWPKAQIMVGGGGGPALTLSKPGFFWAPKTKGGAHCAPLAKTLLPFSESIQVNFFWKLVQKWISWHNFGFHGNHG